jgi:hypothetical protein
VEYIGKLLLNKNQNKNKYIEGVKENESETNKLMTTDP